MVSWGSSMLSFLQRAEMWVGETGRLGIVGWDGDGERRARTRRARQRQLPSEQLGQLAREWQSQAGAHRLPLKHVLDLGELLEDALLVFGGDADAGVRHDEGDPPVGLRHGGHANLAVLGE